MAFVDLLRGILAAPLLLLALAPGTAPAAVDPEAPVVTVNGEAITLRRLEDELLRKEGVEQAQALVDEFLARIVWERLEDQDVIVEIGGRRLTRLDLASYLLREYGAEVRKELIHITLVRQAVAAAGLELDDELLRAEYERQKQAFARKLAERGEDTRVAFADYLQVKEGKTVEQWMAEEGFRMAAALHELVHRGTEVPEALLRQFFEQEFEARYVKPAGLRLRVITATWPTVNVGGAEVIDEGRKGQVMERMRYLGQQIQAGKMDFVEAWRLWGKPFDPQTEDGLVGWVDRDGRSGVAGARRMPAEVMELAWNVGLGEDGTMLLPPVAHPGGVDLVRIEGKRAAQRPGFEQIRDQVRHDFIESRLEELTQAYMERLAIDAEVEYHSLTGLMTRRLQEAGREVAPGAEATIEQLKAAEGESPTP